MDRRRFLKTTPLAVTGLSGCLGTLDPISATGSLPEYVTVEFTVLTEDTAATNVPSHDEPPRVRFDPDDQSITVTGTLMVGSENCNRAVLKSTRLDQAERRFEATVGSGSKEPSGNGCEGNETSDSYRLTAEFDQSYPDEVVLVESGRETRRAEVER